MVFMSESFQLKYNKSGFVSSSVYLVNFYMKQKTLFSNDAHHSFMKRRIFIVIKIISFITFNVENALHFHWFVYYKEHNFECNRKNQIIAWNEKKRTHKHTKESPEKQRNENELRWRIEMPTQTELNRGNTHKTNRFRRFRLRSSVCE